MKQQMCKSKSRIRTLEIQKAYDNINNLTIITIITIIYYVYKISYVYIRYNSSYIYIYGIPIELVVSEVDTEVYETRSL